MTQHRTLVLGPPGTGKTERLLTVMEQALERGVPPHRIAFSTFTKGAVGVAVARVCEKFNLTEGDLPHFRTLHSLCFRALGLRRREVMGAGHLRELAEATGEMIDEGTADPDAPATRMNAHSLLTVDGYARATCRTLRQAWEDHGANLDWFRLKRFADALALYKQERGLVDFGDMLARYVAEGAPLDVDVAILDESQDLTMLQWRVAGLAFAAAQELWAAGDDDQSIHRWAGAAEDHLLSLDWHRETLPLSYRLPRAVHAFAQRISARISRRWDKPFAPADREGKVEWVGGAGEANLRGGQWLLLARTRHQLAALAAEARGQGVLYAVKGAPSAKAAHVKAIRAYEALRAGKHVVADEMEAAIGGMGLQPPADFDAERTWHRRDFPAADFRPIWHDALTGIPLEEREYLLVCLRRGEKLGAPPRVRIDTMHGAKGDQEDNVVLLTDMTPRVQRGYELDPDSEHRVFYVGATRARHNLYCIAPQGAYGYPL